MIITVCEVKPKNASERTDSDYDIEGYAINPVNLDLDSDNGRGIIIYTHASLDKSTVQVTPELSFEEACLLEIRLRGVDVLLFGCIYRSPTPKFESDKNNENLNVSLHRISEKNYSHICLVGDFNF